MSIAVDRFLTESPLRPDGRFKEGVHERGREKRGGGSRIRRTEPLDMPPDYVLEAIGVIAREHPEFYGVDDNTPVAGMDNQAVGDLVVRAAARKFGHNAFAAEAVRMFTGPSMQGMVDANIRQVSPDVVISSALLLPGTADYLPEEAVRRLRVNGRPVFERTDGIKRG